MILLRVVIDEAAARSGYEDRDGDVEMTFEEYLADWTAGCVEDILGGRPYGYAIELVEGAAT